MEICALSLQGQWEQVNLLLFAQLVKLRWWIPIATDEIPAFKQKTTVAMDFGRLQFSLNVALHL